MTSEQLYCFAMIQILLVFLLASFRLQAIEHHTKALPLLQWAIAAELLSWLFYFWPEQGVLLVLSICLSAAKYQLTFDDFIYLFADWPLLLVFPLSQT